VTRSDRIRGRNRNPLQFCIGPAAAYQARTRRLVERDAELDAGYGLHDRLVEILDALDKVALTDNHVEVGRLFDCYGLELHGQSF
jgi:hypothetical protein